MLVARSARPAAGPWPAATLLRVRELSATTVLVAAGGDIDAANGGDLFAGIAAALGGYRQLVLDLSATTFFGAAGYSVLHRVDSRCARAAADWVLVTGPEVTRLLRVCDPDGVFPTAPNIVSAVAVLARGPHRTPQLGPLAH